MSKLEEGINMKISIINDDNNNDDLQVIESAPSFPQIVKDKT